MGPRRESNLRTRLRSRPECGKDRSYGEGPLTCGFCSGGCRLCRRLTPSSARSAGKLRADPDGAVTMASLNYRRGAWELRYRPRDRRERSERFPGPPTKRPPEAALDRKADLERELRRGTFVPREERDITFRVYYERWLAARHVSAAREYTDEGRARCTCCRSGATGHCRASARPTSTTGSSGPKVR